jgi:tetratricopeptide (TPR) repeat protein
MPRVPRSSSSSSSHTATAFAATLFAALLCITAPIEAALAQEQSRGMRVERPEAQSVESLIEAGDKLADAERWMEAAKVYRLATELDPKSGEARLRLAEALMSAGRWEEALDSYRRAVAVDGRNAEAHYALGRALNDMGQHGDAFKPLVRAIQLDPTFAEAHHGIGWAYLRTDQFDKSLPFLRGALRLKPDYDEAIYALALAYYRLGQRAAADEQRRQLAAVNASLLRELDAEVARLARETAPASASTRPAQTAPPTRAAGSPDATAATKGRRSAPRRPAAASHTSAAAQTPRPAAAPPYSPNDPAFELAFWDTIKESTDPEDFRDYLRRYPEGTFAPLARRRAAPRAAENIAPQTPPAAEAHAAGDTEPPRSDAPVVTQADSAPTANPTTPTPANRPTPNPTPAGSTKSETTGSTTSAVVPSSEAARPPTQAVRPPAETRADVPASLPAKVNEAAPSERVTEAQAATPDASRTAAPEADDAEQAVPEAGLASPRGPAPRAAEPAATATAPPAQPFPSRPSYEDLLAQAEEAWGARDAAEAARLLSVAVALAPARPEAFQTLGVVELYGRHDLPAAARAMRAALERGGTAAFAVTHDHDGNFGSFCQGSLYITRVGVAYQSGDGTHAFQAPAADIREAKPHAARGDQSAFFHLRLRGSGGVAENHYFAPGTSKAEETALILSLIPRP